jgi:hypothetical protein
MVNTICVYLEGIYSNIVVIIGIHSTNIYKPRQFNFYLQDEHPGGGPYDPMGIELLPQGGLNGAMTLPQ